MCVWWRSRATPLCPDTDIEQRKDRGEQRNHTPKPCLNPKTTCEKLRHTLGHSTLELRGNVMFTPHISYILEPRIEIQQSIGITFFSPDKYLQIFLSGCIQLQQPERQTQGKNGHESLDAAYKASIIESNPDEHINILISSSLLLSGSC